MTSDSRFVFKAMYKIKDKKSLLRLLKQQDLKGLGGILLEDIQESLPHCDKHLKVNKTSLKIYVNNKPNNNNDNSDSIINMDDINIIPEFTK